MDQAEEIKIRRRQWSSTGVIASAALLACSTLLMCVAVNAANLHQVTGEAGPGGVGVGRTSPAGDAEAFFASLVRPFLRAYGQVWPDMEFGWKIVLGSVIGFLGAALGSVGGVGGGGIFVPMFTLILGFDPKSSASLSKCMIMGTAFSTVFYNFRMRHPTKDLPVVDYDLAVFFQPLMMLGISLGVTFNVIFPEWMIILFLVLLFLGISLSGTRFAKELASLVAVPDITAGTSTRAFFKGIETWKRETVMKKEAAWMLATSLPTADSSRPGYRPLPGGPTAYVQAKTSTDEEITVLDNSCWKDLMLLLFVWVAFLLVQILMSCVTRCSTGYWILSAMQVPIAAAVTLFEAISLYNGKRTVLSRGKQEISWTIPQFLLYCVCGILAGVVGGFLGLGGGFILGPLFLELGVPPQVASATSTFAMAFSSSMSVIQYYLLDRFPVAHAACFVVIAAVAALVGQHIVRKVIILFGRASLIIFVLVLTIFASAVGLAVVGVASAVEKLKAMEYMGFESLCGRE